MTTWTLVFLFYGAFMSENFEKIDGFPSLEACQTAGAKMLHDLAGPYNKYSCFEVIQKEKR